MTGDYLENPAEISLFKVLERLVHYDFRKEFTRGKSRKIHIQNRCEYIRNINALMIAFGNGKERCGVVDPHYILTPRRQIYCD